MMSKRALLAGALRCAAIVMLTSLFAGCSAKDTGSPKVGQPTLRKIVINEAVRTILYLPVYHAQRMGYFKENGLDIEIVTGGTATNAFAAMLSGEAQFSVADPMYVPISREKGSKTRVVAQVVARIALWGVTRDANLHDMSRASLLGKTISTHPQPMTAYTYTVKTIRDAGLEPEKDVKIIQGTPGTEIVPLISGQADFMLTIEPNVSRAVLEGAHVVLSYPQLLGDQIFTGLMTTDDFLARDSTVVQSVVNSLQKAMTHIRSNRASAIETAGAFFPQLPDSVLILAVNRVIDDAALPRTVEVSEDSWNRAIAVRVLAGDLQKAAPRGENCSSAIMHIGASGGQ